MSSKQFARVYSAQPHQLSGSIITVEVDINQGLHAFSIVGLPDKSIDEARDRVGSALKHADVSSPKHHNEKTIVSLAPGDLKKEGVYFDLAIAIGYLLAKGELAADTKNTIFVGELALDGELRPVRGMIALALAAQAASYTTMIVPMANRAEAALIPGLTVRGANNLGQVIDHLNPETDYELPTSNTDSTPTSRPKPNICFSEIKSQEHAKRALTIAAAGGHNVLLYGPPGTGKSMLAQAFAGILPPLTDEQSLQVTAIHSISGKAIIDLVRQAPFESPHHTSSHTAILGGGANPAPGAITLAHHGVLFMDEFPEFDRRVIEGLRQPLEDREVHIARARGKACFPANITLIAAMNPPDPDATPSDIRRLERKLSGPIMDRIDLWSAVEHVDYDTLTNTEPSGATTAEVLDLVIQARSRQRKRSNTTTDWPTTNSELRGKHIDQLDIMPSARSLLNTSASKLKLSPRGYHRVIKVAQTIADLAGRDTITDADMLEALSYRSKKGAATAPYRI